MIHLQKRTEKLFLAISLKNDKPAGLDLDSRQLYSIPFGLDQSEILIQLGVYRGVYSYTLSIKFILAYAIMIVHR